MANFFYLDSTGTKQGPVSQEQLKDLASQGAINPQSDLETDDGHRGKAGQIKGLFPPPREDPFAQPKRVTEKIGEHVNSIANAVNAAGEEVVHTVLHKEDKTNYDGDNPFVWFWIAFSNYVGFKGRARRKEYWMFTLVVFLLCLIPGLNIVIRLATVLPGLALAFRRLHDIGKSGWWLLLGLFPLVGAIILLVWACLESKPGTNKYGPNPKGL